MSAHTHAPDDSHHGHGHGHAHGHGLAASARGRGQTLRVVLLLNAAFLAVEVVVGLLTNSLALLGDALHMGTDVAALLLALAAERISLSPGGPAHTFGYRRAPTLAAFGNALTMVALVLILAVEAIGRLDAPPAIPSTPVLVAGVVGLLVNLGSAALLHARAGHSHNMRGAMLHMLADALGSVGVIVSAVVIAATGWFMVDPIVTLAIGALILAATWPLLRDASRTLLQISPPSIDLTAVRASLMRRPDVACIEDLHAWELDAGYLVVTACVHVRCEDLAACETLRRSIHEELSHGFAAAHLTLELVIETDHPALPERPCSGGL
ncbi:MAG: cation transporter [Deltaproteobacteria bacterium]|nr:cation transporter [Deltaproteobacteria bacterium]MCB9785885.1 cation transporter [Deltaproteobacteria bacterium]